MSQQQTLARRWGLSPSTLERWRHKRKGPPHLKIGGRVRYRLQDIEAFEAGSRRAYQRPSGAGMRSA